MTLVRIALPGTEITYTEGKWRLFIQLVRINADIELQIVQAENELMARALGAIDGQVAYCVSLKDLITMIRDQKVDMLPS